jgi:hypothetical protein
LHINVEKQVMKIFMPLVRVCPGECAHGPGTFSVHVAEQVTLDLVIDPGS